MKWLLPAFLLLLIGCQNKAANDQILSQNFVHKYGFNVSKTEWDDRAQDGQVVTLLKNGVKVTQSYENGQLHGLSTYTFPRSSNLEKTEWYNQGILLKETLYDLAGVPVREEVREFDRHLTITLWDKKGVPLSIEEYEEELLVEGKYFTADHELEAQVESGFGERVKRDRTGLIISKDQIENGVVVSRTSYHPNGQEHTISHYHDYQLHGQQLKYTASGKPLMEVNWNHGIMDGLKTIYRNGSKIAEIPYVNGQKHGTENHYDDFGYLVTEIHWRNDKKHGLTQIHTEEATNEEWFFNGQLVDKDKFQVLDNREKMVAEFRAYEVE